MKSDEKELRKSLLTAHVIALKNMSNYDLSSSYNCFSWLNKIGQSVEGYTYLLKAGLIAKNGIPHNVEILREALLFEFEERRKTGALQ